jgi:hypothetical protein
MCNLLDLVTCRFAHHRSYTDYPGIEPEAIQ